MLKSLNLPTFKFSHNGDMEAFKFIDEGEGGETAFTLSESNYILRGSENMNCYLAIQPIRSNNWILGASLAVTHPILFQKDFQKEYVFGFPEIA